MLAGFQEVRQDAPCSVGILRHGADSKQVAQTAVVAVCGFDVVAKKTSKPEVRASHL
jgi:hypothetical protein